MDKVIAILVRSDQNGYRTNILYMPDKEKIKQTSSEMLSILMNGLGEFYATGMSSYKGYNRVPKEVSKYWDEYDIYKKLKELERRKRLKLKKEGNNIMFEFTKNGVVYTLKNMIINNNHELPEGRVCIVVFDIPEDMRAVRSSLRRMLKQSDFYMIQKSVWESNRDVIDDLRALFNVLKVDQYVRVYHALEVR